MIQGRTRLWKPWINPSNTNLFRMDRMTRHSSRLPRKGTPPRSNNIPKTTAIQNPGVLNMADFDFLPSSSGWFIKSTANTGFMMKATMREAVRVKISMNPVFAVDFMNHPEEEEIGRAHV